MFEPSNDHAHSGDPPCIPDTPSYVESDERDLTGLKKLPDPEVLFPQVFLGRVPRVK